MSYSSDAAQKELRPVFITYPTIYSLLILNYLIYIRKIKFAGIILSVSHIKIKAKNFSLIRSFFILIRKSGIAYALYMLFIIKCKYFIMLIWNIASFLKGRSLNFKTFGKIARERKIPFIKSININNKAAFDFMRSVNANLIVSAYNNQIVRYRIAKLFAYKGINVHNSYLPDFGGLDAAFENLYRGINEAGVTIHYIDKNIDTGDIIVQENSPIYSDDDVFSLNIRQWLEGAKLLSNAFNLLKSGDIQSKKQDLSKIKYSYRSFPGIKRVKVFLLRKKKHLITLKDIFFPPQYIYKMFRDY